MTQHVEVTRLGPVLEVCQSKPKIDALDHADRLTALAIPGSPTTDSSAETISPGICRTGARPQAGWHRYR